MNDENKSGSRGKSTIAFPYSDISDAVAVADGLLKAGGMPLSRDQLAAAMKLSPTGGGFNIKVSTAKMFGVVETSGGKYALTELGFEIMDPGREKEAFAKAFLNVELYKKAYDEFRGKRLPPRPHGLENAFVSFGVAPKQARTARQAFERSARQAGFYPGGDEDRLVMPFGFSEISSVVSSPDTPLESAVATAVSTAHGGEKPGGVGSAIQGAAIHKSILGMLDELPPPKTDWSKVEQANWLDAMATLFQVIYKSDDKGAITVSIESK